jgi:hypothetical protein
LALRIGTSPPQPNQRRGACLSVSMRIAANDPAVVIVGLNTPWDHWTLAHRVTARAVEFFDSYGMRRYPFTSFTLDKGKAGDQPGQKILIDVHQSFRLSRGK